MATLIAPGGTEFVTTSAVQLVRLKAQGYRVKEDKQSGRQHSTSRPSESTAEAKPDKS